MSARQLMWGLWSRLRQGTAKSPELRPGQTDIVGPEESYRDELARYTRLSLAPLRMPPLGRTPTRITPR